MVEYSGETIELAEGTLECSAPIKEVLDIDGNDVLVLLETTGKYDKYDKDTRCRNLWRVGPDGSVRWKIRKGEIINEDYPSFSSVWTEDGSFWAYSTNGLAYKINLETGELSETRQMK
jgi:hypothetical protein